MIETCSILQNGEVEFVFCPADYKELNTFKVLDVFVFGTFTAWQKNENFKLEKKDASGSKWTLVKKASEVCVPGNSGFPEFKFIATAENKEIVADIYLNAPDENRGIKFLSNNIIPEEPFDAEAVINDEAFALNVKSLEEFNLSSEQERAEISNVRKVPGTTCLWRGYHPYKKSRALLDTEETRIRIVNEMLEKNGVKSVITLCGEEKPEAALEEKIYPYMKKIQDAGGQLFVDTSYETVYFDSTSEEYALTVQKIVRFINSHPGAYYIHCRLGSDRTGTMSAVLAALCGASWKEIAADYERTRFMGIQEFRSARLLAYSLSRLLGEDVSRCSTLQKKTASYFVKGGWLTESEINTLVKKLTAK